MDSPLPWCIVGDFNDLLCSSDKEDKSDHPQFLMNVFKATIEETNLIELPCREKDSRGKGVRVLQGGLAKGLIEHLLTKIGGSFFLYVS